MKRKEYAEKWITTWQKLHDRGYFESHPHHRNRRVDEKGKALAILRSYVGVMPEDDVLEIGCGYGRHLGRIADATCSVVGLDIHSSPLKEGRRLLADRPNVKFVEGDGQTLPFPEDSFSLVFAFNTMQHLLRIQVAGYLAETFRVLRRGGRLCFQFLAAPTGSRIIKETVLAEQSMGWTAEEVTAACNGIALKTKVYGQEGGSIMLTATKSEKI